MEVDSENGENGNQTNGRPPEVERRPTFKEKILGKPAAEEDKRVRNLVETGEMKKDLIDGSSFFPMFDFKDPQTYEKICEPWKGCLVVKLLGKHIGYKVLCDRL